jgi:hypothetical protein
MKAVVTLVLLSVVGVRPVLAQGPVRGDVSGTLGWFNAKHGELNRYDEWYNRSLLGEVGLGWYWTDHWKTELMAGASTDTTVYSSVSIVENGQQLFAPSRVSFSTRRLSVTQQYQFGDNQWFHGYLGAGIDAVWQRRSRRDDPIYFYDSVTRQPRLVRGAVDHTQDLDVRGRPAVSAGFKAYLSRQGFFRTDLRLTFAPRPAEVVLRVGVGIDF